MAVDQRVTPNTPRWSKLTPDIWYIGNAPSLTGRFAFYAVDKGRSDSALMTARSSGSGLRPRRR